MKERKLGYLFVSLSVPMQWHNIWESMTKNRLSGMTPKAGFGFERLLRLELGLTVQFTDRSRSLR